MLLVVAFIGTPFDSRFNILERVMGIEPTLRAWEARVLPLNYTRTASLLGYKLKIA